MTWSPSPARSRPWSTNTQISWSPIARCSSAATTDESTPPERPSSTLSRPTCSRTRAIASAMMLPGSQRASQAQISRTKRSSIARALQRVRDLGVELHAVVAARLVGHRRERRVRRRADRHEAGRHCLDAVAVAHPDVEHRAALRIVVIGELVEQPARRRDGDRARSRTRGDRSRCTRPPSCCAMVCMP